MPSIRFQLDEHVAGAIGHALERRGVEVITAAEAGTLGLADDEVLSRCYASGRVLVTHDADFLRLHQDGHQHAGIAFCAQGTRGIGELIDALVLIAEVLNADDMVGRIEFL